MAELKLGYKYLHFLIVKSLTVALFYNKIFLEWLSTVQTWGNIVQLSHYLANTLKLHLK